MPLVNPPCPMILFKVSSSQPDTLLAGEHGQSMRIDSSCTFKGIVGNTLRMKTKKKKKRVKTEITLFCLNRFMKFGTRNYMLRYLPSVDRHKFYRVGREMTKKNTCLDSLHLHKTLIVDLWACDLKIECLTLLFYLHC